LALLQPRTNSCDNKEKENNSCLIQKLHRPPPPLTEEEIDLLLNSHVATPAYIDLQHSHSPEHVSETSSITENENLSLNHDSHGTLEEVRKPIYDDDFQPKDHLVDIVFFMKKIGLSCLITLKNVCCSKML
jgi:hypothetical protein